MDSLNLRPSDSTSVRLRRRRGTSMVEMIFVLPVLLLLLFGMADFSLIFHDYLASMNAARAGVRKATLVMLNCQSGTLQDAGQKIAEEILKANVVETVQGIEFRHSEPGPLDLCKKGHVEMRIRVKSEHKLLSGFLGVVSFPQIEFTAVATAMNENGF